MKTIREAMYEVDYARVLRLIDDWTYYETHGLIGDCELHQATMAYLNAKSAPLSDYETVMREFAFEAFRRVALGLLG